MSTKLPSKNSVKKLQKHGLNALVKHKVPRGDKKTSFIPFPSAQTSSAGVIGVLAALAGFKVLGTLLLAGTAVLFLMDIHAGE